MSNGENNKFEMGLYDPRNEHDSCGIGFIAESVHQTYVMASNLGHGDEYVPRLMQILAEVNGTKLD